MACIKRAHYLHYLISNTEIQSLDLIKPHLINAINPPAAKYHHN